MKNQPLQRINRKCLLKQISPNSNQRTQSAFGGSESVGFLHTATTLPHSCVMIYLSVCETHTLFYWLLSVFFYFPLRNNHILGGNLYSAYQQCLEPHPVHSNYQVLPRAGRAAAVPMAKTLHPQKGAEEFVQLSHWHRKLTTSILHTWLFSKDFHLTF